MQELNEKTRPYERLGVIGAGAWGTSLALTAARAGRQVRLWARETEVVESIAAKRENKLFLPGVSLPASIHATADLKHAVTGAEALLIAAPAQHLRTSLEAVAASAPKGLPLMVCAKGIERTSGKLVTEVFREAAAGFEPAILSGPSFAKDAAQGLPTAVTIAARFDLAQRLQASLSHAAFRPYASDDLIGVALGGAAKNVYAIACGIVDGMGLGESARAALMARGFAELARLGLALAPALVIRARAEKIELPVAETVASVLDGTLALDATIVRLMSRPLKPE
jgi:glycerol-3-phosphate dehydrogenase (NAD(P)+)